MRRKNCFMTPIKLDEKLSASVFPREESYTNISINFVVTQQFNNIVKIEVVDRGSRFSLHKLISLRTHIYIYVCTVNIIIRTVE